MYNVTINNGDLNYIVINSKRSKNRITGKFTKEKNKTPSFTFNIYPDNIGYDLLHEFKTSVRINNPMDGKQKFSGRIILITLNVDSSGKMYKAVTCEGWLGVLNDTINYMNTVMINNTLQKIVDTLIKNHNHQVDEDGYLTMNSFTSQTEIKDYQPSWERTTLEALCDEQLTNHLRYEIIETFDERNIPHRALECNPNGLQNRDSDTEIILGSNMQSLSVTNNFDELCTRCIPLTDDDKPMGTLGTEEMYVDDAEAISNYGCIVKVHKFESIKSTSALKSAAQNWLKNNSKIKQTITISAIDLKGLGITPEEFDIYHTYLISCPHFGISERLELTQLTCDINDVWNTQLTFGEIYYSARQKR